MPPFVVSPFHAPDRDLAAGLARVLFPLVALLGVSGIVVGILNSYDHFTVPALSPVFWNVAIILGLALGVPHVSGESSKLYVYAAVILIATLVQVFRRCRGFGGGTGGFSSSSTGATRRSLVCSG